MQRLARQRCFGCQYNTGSQKHHECLEPEEWFNDYSKEVTGVNVTGKMELIETIIAEERKKIIFNVLYAVMLSIEN
jgi:hypothetical protein